MADEHETESKAWAIEAAAAEAASRAAEEMHRPPVVPMERVVDRTDIERGERAGQKRSQEPGFPRFFAELNLGLRSEEHTSELQSLSRTSYAVFCLKKKK